MNVRSTKVMFLKHLIICKKTAMLLAIILLLAPGFLPHGFVNSKKVVKNNQFLMQNYAVAVTSQAHAVIAVVQTIIQKMIILVKARLLLLPVVVLLMILLLYPN